MCIIFTTKTKAKININRDYDCISTSYLCGHVFRIGTELKSDYLKYTGFIHISRDALEEQYFDVLSLVIKGYINNLKDKSDITILITGFTKFNGTPDNPTSRFLFNDGKSESYGLKKADINKINNMMSSILNIENFTSFFYEGKEVGFTYIYENKDFNTSCGGNAPQEESLGIYAPVPKENQEHGSELFYNKNKKINLAFLRLPVDDNLLSIKAEQKIINQGTPDEAIITNEAGDSTGNMLKDTINKIKPNALISFGAGTYPIDTYNIETISYGMKKETGAIYSTEDKYIVNNDLETIFYLYHQNR